MAYPRSDGTHRVVFSVPGKVRPKGWRPTISLPLEKPRSGDLSDQAEVDRIKQDAIALHRSMTRERLAQLRAQAQTTVI